MKQQITENEFRELKKFIGIGSLVIAGVFMIYPFFVAPLNLSLQRLLFSYSFALIGISLTAWYFTVKEEISEEELMKSRGAYNMVGCCILDMISASGVVGIIYLFFYNTFQKMDDGTFFWMSLFLFVNSGFAISRVREYLIGKKEQSSLRKDE